MNTDPSFPTDGRSIGFVAAVGIGVGAIVGGGIFVLGGVAVAEAGLAAIVAFALNGAIALLTAMVFAELTTSFPRHGGQYLYARRAFSVQAAFGVGWIMIFAHVVAAVLYALGFAAYAMAAAEALLPASMGNVSGGIIRVLSLGITLLVYLPLLLVMTSVGLPAGFDSPAAFAGEFSETFFAESASAYLGSFGFWLVIVAALLSTLTALRANLLAGSRVAMTMARHRTLPRALERLHPRTEAPVTAVAFVCVSAGVLIVVVPDLAAAGAAASLIFLLTFGITHLAGWQIRRRAGGSLPGAFEAPLFPLIPFLGMAVIGLLILFQLFTVPAAGLLLLVWLGFGASIYAGFLSDRAEALDEAMNGLDPLFGRLRGRRTSVLVPLANPTRAEGLASVATALAPPQVGRILLHQVVVADQGTDEARLRKAMEDGNAALSNALVRARREGVHTELLLTVASNPWEEIARIAEEEEVNSVLLGLAQAPGRGEDPEEAGRPAHPIDRLLQRLPCDASLLHGGEAFDLDRVRRVLIPLSGRNDHDRLRARVIGALSRKGLEQLTFLHVLSVDASGQTEIRARSALQAYVRDEARGTGEAYVARAEDPIAEIVERATGFDLLVLGITRPRGGRSRMGELLARMVREAPCPVLIISHPPSRRGRGGARPF